MGLSHGTSSALKNLRTDQQNSHYSSENITIGCSADPKTESMKSMAAAL